MTESESGSYVSDAEDMEREDRLLKALEKSCKTVLAPVKRRGRPPKKRKMDVASGSPVASSQVGSPSSQSQSVTSLVLELLREVRNQGVVFGEKFSKLHDEIQNLKNSNEKLTKKLRERDEEVKDLRFRLENMEMRGRQNEVVISCPSIDLIDKDDFSTPMTKLLRDNLDLTNDELKQFSFRKIGKRALVTVPTAQLRKKMFTASRSRRPANFYVNESLTPERSKFFYDVRAFLRASNVRVIAYTLLGVVHIKKDKNSSPVVIKSLDDVKLFLQAATN